MRKTTTCSLHLSSALALIATTAGAAEEPATPRPETLARTGRVVVEDVLGVRPATPIGLGFAGAAGVGGLGLATPEPTAAGFSYSSADGPSSTVTSFRFVPSVDVFVAGGLSLGAEAGVARTTLRVPGSLVDVDQWGGTLVPRIGYAFVVTNGVALWPRARAGITVMQADGLPRLGPVYRASLDAALVFSLSRNVLFDVAPEVGYTALRAEGPLGAGSLQTTRVGVRGGLSLTF